jgi:hypothetical protein
MFHACPTPFLESIRMSGVSSAGRLGVNLTG